MTAAALTLHAPQSSATPAPPDQWLTRDEVLKLTGWKRAWLFHKLGKGEVLSRLTETVASNGRAVRLFLASSLPPSAQHKLAASRAEQQRRSMQPAPLFAAALQIVQPPGARPRILSPASPEAQLAADRLAKIQPLLEYDADPGRWHHLPLPGGGHVHSKNGLCAYLAQLHGTSERTLWRWARRAGNDALADRVRGDKGTSRWAQAHPRAAELAAHVYLGDADQPGQSVRVCLEAVAAHAGVLGLAESDLPSYETLRCFLANIPPAMKVYAREGRRKYDEVFAPYVRRGYTDIAANEVWVSDHMIHDVYVQNDCFGTRDLGHLRLRFTCLLDMRSRMPVGAAWSEEGSSRSITTALRHAAADFGIPRLLYCDNGKDYQKVARGANGPVGHARPDEAEQAPLLLANIEELRTQGVFARLGVDVLHCIKFHPQSKHVERFFGTLHARFDRLYPTYCGAAPHLRPDAATAAIERHARLVREGRAHLSPLPKASDFIRECLRWLKTEYVHTPQRGAGMEGRSPAEVFGRERWKDARPTPAPDALALLLADRCVRRVRECALELLGARYVPVDAVGSAVMHAMTTQDVVVAYDALDPDRAVALDADGNVLAHLRRERLLGMYHGSADAALAAETKLAIADSMAERKRLVRGMREGREALARQVRRGGYSPKVELLREAARLPASVADVLTHRPAPTPQSPMSAPPLHSEDIGNLWVKDFTKGGH